MKITWKLFLEALCKARSVLLPPHLKLKLFKTIQQQRTGKCFATKTNPCASDRKSDFAPHCWWSNCWDSKRGSMTEQRQGDAFPDKAQQHGCTYKSELCQTHHLSTWLATTKLRKNSEQLPHFCKEQEERRKKKISISTLLTFHLN